MEPIVLQIPDSLKSIVAPLESLIRLLSEQIVASSAASPTGLAPFERALSEHTAELERSAYVPVLAALGAIAVPQAPAATCATGRAATGARGPLQD